MDQEKIVYLIGIFFASRLTFRLYRILIATPLSLFLLRKGKVKWAMAVRQHALGRSSCSRH